MADSDRKKVRAQYNKAYQEFGEQSLELLETEHNRLATREPSQRQQSKWVAWPELRELQKTVVQSLDQTFREAPEIMSVTENKNCSDQCSS